MMKRKLSIFAVTSCFLALAAAATAYAQLPGTVQRAAIPFNFTVKGKIFTAGVYELKSVMDSPHALEISNTKNNNEHAILMTEDVIAAKIPNQGAIVFHKYDDRYYLSQVWAGGEQTGSEVAPSREERNLMNETANNKIEPATVSLATY
jgi:hypothetical protein